ncbi:MAG: sigma-54-dependent Fis family transcriptional regulator [Deltaproteobacteria bacterium]|nr:sigma-54-dependent Fis family transcriptional regulator [Candidatus Anaeroferrophillus wilburensis]MBN2888514.1 sigma-54-dependent Fis family transcriptional regulator [Deltaproteobacteria bacterium]
MISIVIVDDNLELLESLEIYFQEKGYAVATAANGSDGIRLIKSVRPDIAIIDLRLPDTDGLAILKALKEDCIPCKSVVITAYQDMETTVQAIKLGAFDYLHKPVDIDALDAILEKALSGAVEAECLTVPDEHFKENTIIGKSNDLKEIFKIIGLISEVKTTALIVGESGTGKELIARAIHYHSSLADEPFIALNCSAIVENLLESELFGHEQGSFTGASTTKKGKLEIAGNGTLFLDEISEVPVHLQAKLLRFMQEREFERVGGNRKIKFNARIIAAANRDLQQMVNRGEFREDLYFRLKVFEIHVPPLRKRKEDIPLLVEYLVKKINLTTGKHIRRIPMAAVDQFLDYDWPGNIRELENVLTRAMVLSKGDTLSASSIADLLRKKEAQPVASAALPTLKEIEAEHIQRVLDHYHGNISQTARALGITRPTLRNKIKALAIAPTGK